MPNQAEKKYFHLQSFAETDVEEDPRNEEKQSLVPAVLASQQFKRSHGCFLLAQVNHMKSVLTDNCFIGDLRQRHWRS